MALSQSAQMRQAIGRIRRLCCSGIGGQALMPALFSELNRLIPSPNRQFWWAGPQQEVAKCYMEMSYAVALPFYMSEFHDRRERKVIRTFTEEMRTPRLNPAGDLLERLLLVEWRDFLRRDFYNLIWRPCGMMQGIMLKLTEGRRPLGTLNLFRNDREPEFSRRDLEILGALHSIIAHGLHEGPDQASFADTDDSALVILDSERRIRHASAEAHRLLLMALLPHWTPQTIGRIRFEDSPELARLCNALSEDFVEDSPCPAPVLRQRNFWGEFVLRAYWLDAPLGEPSRLIGITINRREPLSLALLRRIETLPLSARQKQLCLLLARGHGAADAAQAMGVSEHTVISHRRNLYNRLGVENRMMLIERLRPD